MRIFNLFALSCSALFLSMGICVAETYSLYPGNGAVEVNPDVRLKITFQQEPVVGNSGKIRIFDASNGKLVDCLDMSIPSGPDAPDMERKRSAVYSPQPYIYESTGATNANTKAGTPSGMALAEIEEYQLTIIGGFTDGFHFHPVIVNGNTAVIYPHHNLLEYGKQYYVTIEQEVFDVPGFKGITTPALWSFTTKKEAPEPGKRNLVVSSAGDGDFNTIQGVMDFIPDNSSERWNVFVRAGDYCELVYFRNKSNVTIKGESREGVVIHYPNNETFNPHPVNIKTNEKPGTFPSRRAAFAADNCTDLIFEDLTIRNDIKGQAEGLLLMGERNALYNVHIIGSGDALQANGSTYLSGCIIDGDGDTILGRGPVYFKNCILSSPGPFMWIRNTAENHGNVFVECTFLGKGPNAVLARSPVNAGQSYPYAEAVLIDCVLENIPAIGWGTISGDSSHVNFAEYNSRDRQGKLIDVSARHPLSRQLSEKQDAATIADYRDPVFVLGWSPDSN